MYYQNLFLFLEYPKNASGVFLSASFGIEVLIGTIVSEFYNSYQQYLKNILNVL